MFVYRYTPNTNTAGLSWAPGYDNWQNVPYTDTDINTEIIVWNI